MQVLPSVLNREGSNRGLTGIATSWATFFGVGVAFFVFILSHSYEILSRNCEILISESSKVPTFFNPVSAMRFRRLENG